MVFYYFYTIRACICIHLMLLCVTIMHVYIDDKYAALMNLNGDTTSKENTMSWSSAFNGQGSLPLLFNTTTFLFGGIILTCNIFRCKRF